MVDFVKLKREVLRIGNTVRDLFVIPIDWFRKTVYDINFYRATTLITGRQISGRKIAIFLIYQPESFPKSVLLTCRHLRSENYNVLLVSNSPVKNARIEELKSLCWRILIRPNFGYDFGGYRDGVRILKYSGIKPDYLIIINDSVWFPILKKTSIIKSLELKKLSFIGPVFIDTPKNQKKSHYQSYFLALNKEAVEARAFVNYWKNLRISNSKRVILKVGEKGFSQAMFEGGFGGSALPTRAVLLNRLERQSNEFLFRTLTYAAYNDESSLIVAKSLIASYDNTDPWRKQALTHMQDALSTLTPIGVFVYASTLLLDLSFLKKRSLSAVYDGMRWQYIRAVKNGDLPSPHPDILEEILASEMDGRLTTDPFFSTPVSATKIS